MIPDFVSDKIKKEVSQQLDPFQISFDNVAHDVLKLDSYSKESRSLMEQWNSYFMQSIKKIESELQKIRTSTADVLQIDSFKEELTEFKDAHARLSAVLQNQQKGLDLLKKDLAQVQHDVVEQKSSHAKHMHSLLDEMKSVKTQITVIQQKISHSQTTITHNKQVVVKKPTPRVVRKVTPQNVVHELSASEQAVLYIFVSKNRALSYKEVAAHYGRAESTVVQIISRLKKRAIPLQVTTGKKGIKLHQLQQSFRKQLLEKSDIVKKIEQK